MYTPPLSPEELDAEIRALLARLMRSADSSWSGSKKPREFVADEMSKRIDPCCELGPSQPVSVYMLHAYVAQHVQKSGKKLRFPAAFVPAICEITQNFGLLRLIVGEHLSKLIELDKKGKARKRVKQHGGLHVVTRTKSAR